jgi:hypothetical protein
MEYWETTLTSLLAKDHWKNCGPQLPNFPKVPETGKDTLNSFDAETVIHLKTKINQFVVVKGSNSVYHAFKPKKETLNFYNPDFYGNTHCESNLVTFFTCGSGALLCMTGVLVHPDWLQVICVGHCSVC